MLCVSTHAAASQFELFDASGGTVRIFGLYVQLSQMAYYVVRIRRIMVDSSSSLITHYKCAKLNYLIWWVTYKKPNE